MATRQIHASTGLREACISKDCNPTVPEGYHNCHMAQCSSVMTSFSSRPPFHFNNNTSIASNVLQAHRTSSTAIESKTLNAVLAKRPYHITIASSTLIPSHYTGENSSCDGRLRDTAHIFAGKAIIAIPQAVGSLSSPILQGSLRARHPRKNTHYTKLSHAGSHWRNSDARWKHAHAAIYCKLILTLDSTLQGELKPAVRRPKRPR